MQVNYAITLLSESEAMVLPPDTTDEKGCTIPFYMDPPDRPGLHRDQFKAHARQMLGKLLVAGFKLSQRMLDLVPEQFSTQAVAEETAETAAAATSEGFFMIRQILAERHVKKRSRVMTQYLVEWEGYDPSWEQVDERARGQPGELPFTSWQPAKFRVC